ncbi:hypothetical protein GCM10007853_04030 [Algimonas ampicilliniresistens]|uniref:Ankyrin repeat domain-containing protein n=1 Tax=Algimonas ampicilliniresistens TaxID=1298735 RepID=A0ABQ5V730_9PROT|nr:ankyrin repeat domain-containing protein [Algimonas ampicilliniresistens]GLQ22529.1 hypothetical protein GCM10007853_04030 [Algimonas ampicilliniresistens]
MSQLLKEYPWLQSTKHSLGGDALYYAVLRNKGQPLDLIVSLLENYGFDVNTPTKVYGDAAIAAAAREGDARIVRYLLSKGAKLDTSASIRNPMFAAINGKAQDVMQILIDAGIDLSVKYYTDTMNGLDAAAFAAWNMDEAGLDLLAKHLGKGDPIAVQAIKVKAHADAASQILLAGPSDDELDEFEG